MKLLQHVHVHISFFAKIFKRFLRKKSNFTVLFRGRYSTFSSDLYTVMFYFTILFHHCECLNAYMPTILLKSKHNECYYGIQHFPEMAVYHTLHGFCPESCGIPGQWILWYSGPEQVLNLACLKKRLNGAVVFRIRKRPQRTMPEIKTLLAQRLQAPSKGIISAVLYWQ